MAVASFTLYKCTGTNAATETDCTRAPKFLNSDETSTDTAGHPVAVPKEGSPNYSFEVWLRFKCTSPPNSYCQSFKVWGPNLPPDGVGLLQIYMGKSTSGVTPVTTQSSIATSRADTNFYSVDSGLALGLTGGATQITPANYTSVFPDWVVAQLWVLVGATRGDMTLQTFYIGYEEV